MSKVIMISRDPKALDADSAVGKRIQEYRALFDELDVVVINGNIFSFFKSFFTVAKIARKIGRGNWITSQDPFEAGILAYVIAKLFGLRLQLQLHTDIFSHFYPRASLGNFFRTLLARFLLPRADSVRVVSNKIKESLKGLKNVFVLSIFVDVQSIAVSSLTFNLREKYPQFTKIILVVARLEKEKNLLLALNAFYKMVRNNPKVGLVVVGGGKEEARLKSYAKHLGINRSVQFEGWLSDPSSAYKSADLLLVTSFYEGYGMNIIEALACGCPVISTDVGIAAEAGATIANYDAGDIALKAEEILTKGTRGVLTPAFGQMSKQEYLQKFKATFGI